MTITRIGDYYPSADGWVVTHEEVGVPAPRIITAKPLGVDGIVDLTESVTGRVMYDNRSIVINLSRWCRKTSEWVDTWRRIASLHGTWQTIVLSIDPFTKYEGRVSVSAPDRSGREMKVSIKVDAKPFGIKTVIGHARCLAGMPVTFILDEFGRKCGTLRLKSENADMSVSVEYGAFAETHTIAEFDGLVQIDSNTPELVITTSEDATIHAEYEIETL